VPSDGEHRHCRVCGRVTRPDEETCSAECAAERARRLGAARTYRYLLYGLMALVVLVVLGSYLR
jgi:predicted nucleic acid-binding Zn ribbon protein